MTTKPMRGAGRALLPVALMLSLAACAGPQGARSVASTGAEAPAVSSTAPAPARAGAPGSAAAARGGYYLDDGPGSNPPADVSSIPDAVPRAEELLPRTMRPYSVFGRQYTPMTRLEAYRERGIASWYGKRYHGQPTSSGEPYDMYAMTAAHPTLPIPSYARVTHTASGRSVVVRINDRGPFLHDRVIDLSYTAAAKLGYVASGSAEVEVESITQFEGTSAATPVAAATPRAAAPARDEPLRLNVETVHAPDGPSRIDVAAAPAGPPPAAVPVSAPAAAPASVRAASALAAAPSAAPAATGATAVSAAAAPPPGASKRGFWLQLGAFGTLESARGAMAQLARRLDWLGAPFDIRQEGALYKVQAGPWQRREHAAAVAERIRAATDLRPFATLR